MFVELTISQSAGNDQNFKVLKPLNEKHAIKCFADGLRNRRLIMVIIARNFQSLQNAIQTVIDEDITSTSSEIFTFNNNSRITNSREYRGRPSQRGMSY